MFSIGDRAFTVWIEHIDPLRRSTDYGWNPRMPVSETNRPPKRFTLCELVDGDPLCRYRSDPASVRDLLDEREIADGEPLLDTDSEDELVGSIARDLGGP